MVSVDLGAQSGRVAVGRLDDGRLSVTEVHRFPNVPVRGGGRLQWDVLRLYADVVAGLRAAGREAGRVASVAVDSWAVDFGLLDRKNRLVQNPVHYRDSRRAAAMESVLGRVPARELYERTGIQLIPINTIFELAAMADESDPALEAAETLLLIPDLIHNWLCGSRTSEHTNATTTQCLDAREGVWARDLAERLGIPRDIFPEVVPPATVLGPLSGKAAHETGLGAASVVAGATHDTAAAVAAVPFRRADAAYVSAGTWSLVGLEVDNPVIDDRTFGANLTNEGGVGGTVRLLRNLTGLWLLDECRRTWALADRDLDYEELLRLAVDAAPLRSLVDPNDPLFAEPGDMPARIADSCVRSGQPEPAESGAVVRCIFESLALKHAETVDLLRDATGVDPAEIHVVGGGARNGILCRWTADAAGRPVLAGPEEATTIGNLVVQAMALGELSSLDEAREVVRASFAPTVYEPTDEAAWREARGRFAELTSGVRAREQVGA